MHGSGEAGPGRQLIDRVAPDQGDAVMLPATGKCCSDTDNPEGFLD